MAVTSSRSVEIGCVCEAKLKASDTSNFIDENVYSMSRDSLDYTDANICFRSEYDTIGTSIKAAVVYLGAALVKVSN